MLLLATLALAVVGCSAHPQRNVTGVASPYYLPSDAAVLWEVVVRGEGFGTPAEQPSDLTCVAKGSDWALLPGHGDDGAGGVQFYWPNGTATVLNDTAVRCMLPGALTEGKISIAIESPSNADPAKHVWWSSGTSAAERVTMLEVTPGKRPYLSNETSDFELLVWPDLRALPAGGPPSVDVVVCATLQPSELKNPYRGLIPEAFAASDLPASLAGLEVVPCTTLTFSADATRESVRARSLPFAASAASKIPSHVDAVLNVTVVVGGSTLVAKLRRFSVAPVAGIGVAPGSVVTVDHRRRMLRTGGEQAPWLGVGFYATVWGEYLKPGGTVGTLQDGLDVFTELAQHGVTHVQPYGMEGLNATDLALVVAHMEKHGIMFGFSVVAAAMALHVSEPGSSNFTTAWSQLEAAVESVRDSPSLLGYYLCDDCNQADKFPPFKQAGHLHDLQTDLPG